MARRMAGITARRTGSLMKIMTRRSTGILNRK